MSFPVRKVPVPFVPNLLCCLLAFAVALPGSAEILLQGQVTDTTGAPLVGVRAELLEYRTVYERSLRLLKGQPPEPVAVATSGEEGNYSLAVPEVGVWAVRLSSPGFVTRNRLLLPVVESMELPTATLEPAIVRRLQVMDEAGEGVAVLARLVEQPQSERRSRSGKAWRIAEWAGWSAEDGVVELALSEDVDYSLSLMSPGYRPVRRAVEGQAGALQETLKPALPEPFQVVTPSGKALADVVVLSQKTGLPLVLTDDAGFGQVTLAEASRELTILASENRRANVTLPEIAESKGQEDAPPPVLRLQTPDPLEGTVIDQSTETALAGAVVWSGGGGWLTWTFTDRSGGYSLRLENEDTLWIQATATGYSREYQRVPKGVTQGPTLGLHPALRLEGVVVDEDDAPVAEVDLQLFERRTRRFTRGGAYRAQTDEEGRFVFSAVSKGFPYWVRFAKEGYASGQEELGVLESSQDGLRWVLLRGLRGYGQVVDEDDRPVVGAEVRLQTQEEQTSWRSRRDFGGNREKKATTDAEGRFELLGLHPGPIELRASAEGLAPTEVPGIELVEGEESVDLGVLVLGPGAVVEGRVVDESEQPLADVRIALVEGQQGMPFAMARYMIGRDSPVQNTGTDGKFRFTGLRPGQRLSVVTSLEGYVDQVVPGITAPLEEPLEIELQLGSRVSGRVLDTAGAVVKGAQVSLGSVSRRMAYAGPGQSVESDEEGRFQLAGIEPGTMVLTAKAGGFKESTLSGLVVPEGGGALEDVEIVLERGATLRGRLLEADGKGVEEALILVQEAGGVRGGEGFAKTDGEGAFEVGGLGFGALLVTAHDPKGRQVSETFEMIEDSAWIELRFEAGFEISGRVVDAAGAPLEGATVQIMEKGGGRRSFLGPTQERSDAGGSFRFTSIAPGVYRVVASHPNTLEGEYEEDVAVRDQSISGLEIQLRQGTTLSGQISGLEYDDMVQVRVRTSGGGRGGQVDYEGQYRLEHVPPGEWDAVAILEGSGRQVRQSVRIEEGAQEVTLDFEFGSGLRLTGTVLVDQEPLAGAIVTLRGESVAARFRSSTRYDGKFFLEGLEAGRYEIRIQGQESGLNTSRTVDITSDDDLLIEMTTARLAGRVVDARDGQPIDGVDLRLVRQEGNGSGLAVSDARGDFHFGRVGEGSWRLAASKTGFAQSVQVLDIQPGDVLDNLRVALEPTSKLTFRVADPNGLGIDFVNMVFLDGAGRTVANVNRRLASDGQVELSTVPEGTWTLLIESPGRVLVERQVTVPGVLDTVLLPFGGSLQVEVKELATIPAPAVLELWTAGGSPLRKIHWDGSVRSQFPLTGSKVVVGGLAPGGWSFRVTTEDGRSWEGVASVAAGEQPATVVLP